MEICGACFEERKMNETQKPALLDMNAAAARLGLSVGRLRSLINRGLGPPFVLVDSRKNFREKTLEAWLAKRERESLKILKRNRDLARKFGGE